MKPIVLLMLLITALTAAAALAADGVHSITLPVVTVELKAGEGRDKAAGYCAVCHSLDYITMQPPFSRAQWTATTNKMIKVMGAPIPEADARIIIDYLSTYYGTGK